MEHREENEVSFCSMQGFLERLKHEKQALELTLVDDNALSTIEEEPGLEFFVRSPPTPSGSFQDKPNRWHDSFELEENSPGVPGTPLAWGDSELRTPIRKASRQMSTTQVPEPPFRTPPLRTNSRSGEDHCEELSSLSAPCRL